MPWKDQLRLGWLVLRWMWWPVHKPVWSNVADLIIITAITISVAAQIWLGLLAGFFLFFAVGFAARKQGPRP